MSKDDIGQSLIQIEDMTSLIKKTLTHIETREEANEDTSCCSVTSLQFPNYLNSVHEITSWQAPNFMDMKVVN